MSWIELPKVIGSGGGAPGGGNGDIQINIGGSFAGDSQLQWDSINKAILLNGLAIRVLSTAYSLVDSNLTPTTITSWPTTYGHTIIEFSLDRGSDTLTGTMLISNTNVTVKMTDAKIDTSETGDGALGITFSTAIQAGPIVVLQYTSTATGQNATMRIAARQW
jgi:hypothetical protein